MKAIEPVAAGFVERDGVKLHWQEFGAGEPTIVLLPTWSIIDSRFWKSQVPYLSRAPSGRHVRRPGLGSFGPARRRRRHTRHLEFAADTLAVLDATDTPDGGARRPLVRRAVGRTGRRRPSRPGARHRRHRAGGPAGAAASRPHRATRSTNRSTPPTGGRSTTATTGRSVTTGTSSSSSLEQCCTEPHSTKQIDDCIELGARHRSGPTLVGAATKGWRRAGWRASGRSASGCTHRCS